MVLEELLQLHLPPPIGWHNTRSVSDFYSPTSPNSIGVALGGEIALWSTKGFCSFISQGQVGVSGSFAVSSPAFRLPAYRPVSKL